MQARLADDGFEALGHGAGQAKWPALVEISRMATRQARFLSPLDGFWFATGVAPCGAALAIWQKLAD